MADFYSILGLPYGASKLEVKKAYRRLAMQWHPDKNPSPEARQKFILITQAYDALMEGRTYASSQQTRTYSSPKPAAAPQQKFRSKDEIRRESMQVNHARLLKKFLEIRNHYCRPGQLEENRNAMYKSIRLQFGLSGGVLLAAILVPFLLMQPGFLIISFPLGLGFGLRLFWKAGRKKMRADMIFGKETDYSLEALRDFFETRTRIGTMNTMSGGSRRPYGRNF